MIFFDLNAYFVYNGAIEVSMQIAKNRTVLTKKDVVAAQNLSILKSSWLVAIFAVVLVLMAFRIRNGQFVFESIFFAVVGAATLPIYFLIMEVLMIKQNKKLPKKTVFEYIFTDEGIIASASDEISTETFELKYSQIAKCKIDHKYIIIIIDKNTSMLVKKAGFENEGELEKIINLLKLKVVRQQKQK